MAQQISMDKATWFPINPFGLMNGMNGRKNDGFEKQILASLAVVGEISPSKLSMNYTENFYVLGLFDGCPILRDRRTKELLKSEFFAENSDFYEIRKEKKASCAVNFSQE